MFPTASPGLVVHAVFSQSVDDPFVHHGDEETWITKIRCGPIADLAEIDSEYPDLRVGSLSIDEGLHRSWGAADFRGECEYGQ